MRRDREGVASEFYTLRWWCHFAAHDPILFFCLHEEDRILGGRVCGNCPVSSCFSTIRSLSMYV